MSEPTDLVKGIDDHIRVVYFALMGLALLLLAASLTTPGRTYEKPIRDLEAIIHLREDEGKLRQRFEVEINKRVASHIQNREQEYQNGQPITVAEESSGATGELYHSYHKIRCAAWVWAGNHEPSTPGSIFFTFESLEDFGRVWNEHAQRVNSRFGPANSGTISPDDILVLRTIEPSNLIQDSVRSIGSLVPRLRLLSRPEVAELTKKNISIVEVAENIMASVTDSDLKLEFVGAAFGFDAVFNVAPEFEVVPMSLQQIVRNQAGQDDNWFLGTFDKSFPELQQAAVGLMHMPLSDLLEFFKIKDRDQRERRTENIEIFGAKIPGDKLGICGIALLLGVQIYLLLNLRRLSKILAGSSDLRDCIVWLGGDANILARTFVVISAVVFPSFVVVVLTEKLWSTDSLLNRAVSAFSLVASIVVAFATFINLHRVAITSTRSPISASKV